MMVLMQIYLLRHGIAESVSTTGLDADRELTEPGRQKVRQVVKAAGRAGIAPTLIISSPYRRALATAKIAADLLGGELVESRTIEPGGDPQTVWEEIRVHKGEESLMLVGHEPLFSALGAYLLGAPEIHIDFKKSALMAIEIPEFGALPRGILKWMLTAKLCD
jgi:phosphohistidine phosphatase